MNMTRHLVAIYVMVYQIKISEETITLLVTIYRRYQVINETFQSNL